ncbi:MAG: response regulator [Deltaproteobacteria bacterium]|nr:response regulator [Deltaproteobacteria bacterium]
METFKRFLSLVIRYYSILGMKIMLSLGVLFFAATLINLYYQGGADWTWAHLFDPGFWVLPLAAFLAAAAVLSKVVILPLKRFELHVKGLESGDHPASLAVDTDRKDELGYLFSTFDKYNKSVTQRLSNGNKKLDTIHDFMDMTSSILDLPELMDGFFIALKHVVSYDLGAYIIARSTYVHVKVFDDNPLKDDPLRHVPAWLHERISSLYPSVDLDSFLKPDTVAEDQPRHIIELPIVCNGKPSGTIILASRLEENPFANTKVLESILLHMNMAIERILRHLDEDNRALEHILSSMSDGVLIMDNTGHVTTINARARDLISLFCRYDTDCISGNQLHPGRCRGQQKEPCGFGAIARRLKGDVSVVDGFKRQELTTRDHRIIEFTTCRLKNSDNNKGYVIMARDITEDRNIQRKVSLSSKLAALGEMSAGVAHEINNPLQVILSNIEIIEPAAGEAVVVKRLKNMKDAVLRIKSIVRDLLVFAREQTTDADDIDINPAVKKAVDIMHPQLGNVGIKLSFECTDTPLVVRCNGNLLQQVIVNLLQNAKDAIEETGIGETVSVRTSIRGSNFVIIEVSDNGPGMSNEVMDKIFDPFFTTKDVGKGTGLGLSVSRKSIKSVGGDISVVSTQGRGTLFEISLPMSNTTAKESIEADQLVDKACLLDKQVMAVDDDMDVLGVIRQTVGPNVSSLDCVANGKTAVEKMLETNYDIVLLDINMPGLSGREVYKQIREKKPYLAERIIFLTGDTESEKTNKFLKLTNCQYLSKPFQTKELLYLMCQAGQEQEI